MRAPSPAAGRTQPGRGRPRRPDVTWPRMLLYTAPVVAVAAAWPYIGGHAVSFTGHALPRLAALGIAVAAGMYLRQLRNRRSPSPV